MRPASTSRDVEAPRTVGSELELKLDVPGARRPGDEVDGARRSGAFRPESRPDILEVGDEAVTGEHRDVGLRQEVEGGRSRPVRHEDDGARLGDSGVGAGHAHPVLRLRRAPRDRELVRPAYALHQRVRGDHDLLVEPVLLEIVGDRPRHAVDSRHRRKGRGHQRHLLREARREIALHGRADVHLVGGDARLDLLPPGRGLGRVATHCGADRIQDPRPRIPGHRPEPRRRQACWNVSPSGAGRSRAAVQPPASGSRRKAPRRRPSHPITPIAAPVRSR